MKSSRLRNGSALLVVVLLSSAFLLYASSLLWVHTLLKQGVEQKIKIKNVNALADGLADYALALYIENKLNVKDKNEFFFSSWPQDSDDGFSGKVLVNEKFGNKYKKGAHIKIDLEKEGETIQSIEYSVKQEKQKYQIYDFKRLY